MRRYWHPLPELFCHHGECLVICLGEVCQHCFDNGDSRRHVRAAALCHVFENRRQRPPVHDISRQCLVCCAANLCDNITLGVDCHSPKIFSKLHLPLAIVVHRQALCVLQEPICVHDALLNCLHARWITLGVVLCWSLCLMDNLLLLPVRSISCFNPPLIHACPCSAH